MEKKKKKVYYISEIAKVYEDYENDTVELAGHIAEASIFTLLTVGTIWLPFLSKIDPSISDIDKCKSIICGLGIPAVSIPLMISKIKAAIYDAKSRRENMNFLEENRRDITDEELIEYIEGDGIHKMVRNFNKQEKLWKRKIMKY